MCATNYYYYSKNTGYWKTETENEKNTAQKMGSTELHFSDSPQFMPPKMGEMGKILKCQKTTPEKQTEKLISNSEFSIFHFYF